MATIGWIGLGNMGKPMTKNLVAAGHTVRGYDLNSQAVAEAEAGGVTACGSIAEAVDGAEAVFTMLPKGEHARSVYLDAGGVFETASTEALLVDSSTIDVESAQALHEAAEKSGFAFVDAPVSGGISGAAAGTLTFMLGGSEADAERAKAYIDPMAGNIFYAGAGGLGQAAKIVNNMMLAISLEGAAEGAVLARKLGLDAQTFWDIAHVSSGDSWPLRTWYPVPGVVETAAANKGFDATFSAMLAHKDVGLALAGAESVGVELPAAQVAYSSLQKLVDDGYADKDCSLIIRNIDPEAPGVPQE
ncbi:3-hydroxyisobutyrate dehydrogenase [Brevibacterium daeguense]|uniref:3-hydroxyisobutyrate dehydrogenase n=1 Tax=Brevibacterium daeguense TaxID=909936 RepID=A0ABP8EI18_9MICO|nr:3-hydroxyisobutyrate dehydrogenase [Brevibacterium daeguense]